MIAIPGVGLHTGIASELRLIKTEGALSLNGVALSELTFDGQLRSTRSTSKAGVEIKTVEHLFAALGALSIRSNLQIEVSGSELPIVDGAAAAFYDALSSLNLPSTPTRLVVARDDVIEIGQSRYELRCGEDVAISAEVDFEDERIEKSAQWLGSPSDFRFRIAPARTFAFERDLEHLAAAKLAHHVPRESVVLITRAEILSSGSPYRPDEPARHKLLDLIGDLFAHGGPPRGAIHALRPGHAATHAAMRIAFERKSLEFTPV